MTASIPEAPVIVRVPTFELGCSMFSELSSFGTGLAVDLPHRVDVEFFKVRTDAQGLDEFFASIRDWLARVGVASVTVCVNGTEFEVARNEARSQ